MSSQDDKFLIVIAGPTASGKTVCAIDIAQHFNTEILSCDSRQVYREISIGTAKPSEEELAQVPHHFINSHSIHDNYDAGQYEKDVDQKLNTLFTSKNVVVMAGGTGLFIKAAIEGLDDLPDGSEEIRQYWKMQFEERGVEALQEKLKELDPEKFESMDSYNPQRLIRAIEICLITGKKHADLQTASVKTKTYNIIGIALDVERDVLYERINQRVDEMMNSGLLEEVKSVHQYANLNALKTVGYSELFDYLNGKCELDFAIDKIKQHSRNYAKRQITWFNKMNLEWFSPENKQGILSYIESEMKRSA